jgi:hypothetical protein
MISVNLNLGCGKFPKEGYLNIDVDPTTKPDKVMNLNEFSYDLPSNYFEL